MKLGSLWVKQMKEWKDPKLKKATLKKHLADMYTNTGKLKDRLSY